MGSVYGWGSRDGRQRLQNLRHFLLRAEGCTAILSKTAVPVSWMALVPNYILSVLGFFLFSVSKSIHLPTKERLCVRVFCCLYSYHSRLLALLFRQTHPSWVKSEGVLVDDRLIETGGQIVTAPWWDSHR